MHSVERVVRLFNNVNAVFQSFVKLVNIVGVDVEIHFAPPAIARFAVSIEHDFLRLAKRHHGKAEVIAGFIRIGRFDCEADFLVPGDGGAHVGDVNHRDDFFRKGFHG